VAVERQLVLDGCSSKTPISEANGEPFPLNIGKLLRACLGRSIRINLSRLGIFQRKIDLRRFLPDAGTFPSESVLTKDASRTFSCAVAARRRSATSPESATPTDQ
jgi:hypothetical protein